VTQADGEDAGVEIEVFLAIDIGHPRSLSPSDDERLVVVVENRGKQELAVLLSHFR
jgi:hypothetical protein